MGRISALDMGVFTARPEPKARKHKTPTISKPGYPQKLARPVKRAGEAYRFSWRPCSHEGCGAQYATQEGLNWHRGFVHSC